MKKIESLKRIFAIIIAMLMMSAVLSSCKTQSKGANDSSEITASESVTSKEDKVESGSSQPEKEEKPESKASESKQPEAVSSKPQSVSSKPPFIPAPKPKTPQELIIGKWTATVDVTPSLTAQGYTVEGPMNITGTYEFTPSNSAILTLDKPSFAAALKTVSNTMIQEELAASGLTQTEFEAQIGMTLDEYLDTTISSMIDALTTFVCTYKFEGDKLYIKFPEQDTYTHVPYSFSGEDSLTLTEDGEKTTYKRLK